MDQSCRLEILNFICIDSIKLSDLLTIFIAGIAAFVAWRTWESQKANNLIYVDELISTSKSNYREICKLILNNGDIINREEYKSLFNESLEDIVNAYESACCYYLIGRNTPILNLISGVIDRKIFKSVRRIEILQLMETPAFKNIIKDLSVSEYKNLWRVYLEFTKEQISKD